MKFKYKTKPYEHQLEALVRSHDKKNYGYFMEMGCGKSKVLLDNIAWLYDEGHIDTAVIVAPKGVYINWQTNEIPAHMPDHIPHEVYVWKASPNKKQKDRLIEAVSNRDSLRILLVNVEGFATAKHSSRAPRRAIAFKKSGKSNFCEKLSRKLAQSQPW